MHKLEKESGVNIGGLYCLRNQDVLIATMGLMKIKNGLIIVSYRFLKDIRNEEPTFLESTTFNRLYEAL